ncbi:MAG: dUTP diphosphatase [Puniceicoccales bacterium]|jgi:dimeric dUTPase (all-alpha-NTP-PPase superfamily)|nr:dUTP diphosphatase [Puniceicoccales bacterium]
MDKLEKMFEMQRGLNVRILGEDVDRLHQEETAKWILNYARALQQEVSELVDCVPWKWWAHYQKMDVQNARVELVDIVHFVICLAQVLGMSADDLFNAYLKKNEVNHHRQDVGYVQKDETDSLHI